MAWGASLGAAVGEPEQVTEATDIASGGQSFVQDAVFSDCLGGDAESSRDPWDADRAGPHGGVEVDEQVRAAAGAERVRD